MLAFLLEKHDRRTQFECKEPFIELHSKEDPHLDWFTRLKIKRKWKRERASQLTN